MLRSGRQGSIEPAGCEVGACQRGKSLPGGGTQVPARVVVKVKGPLHRRIAFGRYRLGIERGTA
ncbi:hypothetical protein LG277_03405 [Vreelandella aquamarina]|uniref:hypothetical protein n=1 Tax=Vreelandella aquamarina TaxID=77097 RepID=UPI00384C6CA1